MDKPYFSIIVPVYNGEKTIKRCLLSILSQSFANFELIVINDGSEDRTTEICHKMASEDNRVTVINQPNGGVSRARNNGLDRAKGKYICFVDADDIVFEHWLEKYAIEGDFDLLSQGCLSESENNHTIKYHYTEIEYDNPINALTMIAQVGLFNSPWSKSYKASIIRDHDLRFMEDCHLFEDLIFSLQFSQHVTSVKLLSYVGYKYIRSDSVLTKKFNPAQEYRIWIETAISEAMKFVDDKNENKFARIIITSLFSMLSWYTVQYFDRIKKQDRYDIYKTLNKHSKMVDYSRISWNRKPFMLFENKNTLLDIMVRIEYLLVKFRSMVVHFLGEGFPRTL